MSATACPASDPRRSRRGSRGGLLVEAVLSLLLVAAGALLWVLWRRGAVTAAFSRPAAGPGEAGKRLKGDGADTAPAAPAQDARETSAWTQSRVRDILAECGVRDKHVLKSYNRQRDEKGSAWLEDTMEIKAPTTFDGRGFLARLLVPLRTRGLRVMTDKRAAGAWRLEIGDGRRVFQRLIVFEVPAAGGPT